MTRKILEIGAIMIWLLAMTDCFAQKKNMEEDILIPYEVDGKIGFVNQRLEKITEARYLAITSISKYCAVVQTEGYRQAIVTFDGKEITRELSFGDSMFLIGDEYYGIPEASQDASKRTKTIIYSVFTQQEYVVHDLVLEGGSSLEYIRSTNVYYREYSRLNCVNYKGEFKFPVDNKWKRLHFYEEALGRGIILDDDFDGRIIDRAGNFVGGYKWQSIAQEFGDGLVAGIKDDRAGYYDKDGVLMVPVQFHVENDIHLAPRFNSGILPCRIIDGVLNVYSREKQISLANWSLIDTEGNVVADKILADNITEFSDGVAVLKLGDLYYLIKHDGEKLLSEGFDSIQPSINGYCRAKIGETDYIISSQDGKIFKCEEL